MGSETEPFLSQFGPVSARAGFHSPLVVDRARRMRAGLIAQRLFLTVKTTEMHMTGTLAKLAVS